MSIINLPLLPLLKAFEHLSDLDMINLSFCSRKTSRLVKVSRRFTSTSGILYKAVGECLEISVRTFNSKFTIRLEPLPRGQVVPRVPIQNMAVQETISLHGFGRATLSIRCDHDPSGIIFYDTWEDFVVLHEALTKHFLDLYVTPPQLSLILAPSDILTYPFLKNWEKRNLVIISQYTGRNYVSSEEMRFLLSDSVYTKCLNVYRTVENGFQYWEGFKLNKINFYDSSWVQMDSIINSTSQTIILEMFPTPTASQLINLLKLWIAKEKMANLTILELSSDYVYQAESVCSEFRKEVWQGIGLSRLDAATTGEILRVDGVRARVYFGYSNFCFRLL